MAFKPVDNRARYQETNLGLLIIDSLGNTLGANDQGLIFNTGVLSSLRTYFLPRNYVRETRGLFVINGTEVLMLASGPLRVIFRID